MSQPNPPRATTVPATLAAIKAGLVTAIADPSTPVLLGIPTQWPERGESVVVAASVPGSPGVQHNLTYDPRTQGYEESYDITMAIVSLGDGSGDMESSAARAGALFDVVRSWCEVDRSLGDTVAGLRLGNGASWVPNQRGDGPEWTVGFVLHVAADV